MALENHLSDIKAVKGYQACGIMHFTGELLAYDSAVANIDLGLVGATFNDVFRTAHEVCEKIGLEAAREMVLITPRGLIVMLCSGTKSKAHFHMITILSGDGNQALAKMQMEKAVPGIVGELA